MVPSQMSEPWHASKPVRQTGCTMRIGGCVGARRVIDGVSTLLLPLPLRYAAVVPAQNALGCAMPREVQWGFSTRKVLYRST